MVITEKSTLKKLNKMPRDACLTIVSRKPLFISDLNLSISQGDQRNLQSAIIESFPQPPFHE